VDGIGFEAFPANANIAFLLTAQGVLHRYKRDWDDCYAMFKIYCNAMFKIYCYAICRISPSIFHIYCSRLDGALILDVDPFLDVAVRWLLPMFTQVAHIHVKLNVRAHTHVHTQERARESERDDSTDERANTFKKQILQGHVAWPQQVSSERVGGREQRRGVWARGSYRARAREGEGAWF